MFHYSPDAAQGQGQGKIKIKISLRQPLGVSWGPPNESISMPTLPTIPTLPTPRRQACLVVAALSLASVLPGCAVVTVAGAVAGAAISVGGAVVSTGVKVTGKVIEKTVDAVTPGDAAPAN